MRKCGFKEEVLELNDVKKCNLTSKVGSNDVPHRGEWANKFEFLLSCCGYCIGIGNVWRFPYLCYRNGGGAFLVPYLLMLFLCGIPLFFMETVLGQFSSSGCITVFRMSPLFKGAGFAILVVNLICTAYYNVIVAYPLYFLVMSFRSKLPWHDCDNPWNTPVCRKIDITSGYNKTSTQELLSAFNLTATRVKTPADEFFHNKILKISDGISNPGSVVWELLVGDIISWIVVYLCIMKGVKSIGKVVYFTATFPFLVLFVLLVRGLTLPGAMEGVIFYISPQWNQLTNLKVWADAASQIFYSLGPGWGGIVNMASYNKFNNNLKSDAVFIPILNCGTSIFAGFVVFSVLGFMSHETGIPVSTVATGGPGLAFVTYPQALTLMPFSQLWAILFFLMLYFLGLDSCFVQIEAIITSVTDEYPKLRKRKQLVLLLSLFVMFIGSLSCITNGGMYVLALLDWYCASMSVILICITEIIIVGWIYGTKSFVRDIEFMIHQKISCWWPLCWKYISPTILVSIFMTTIIFNTPVTYNGISYPLWALILGWSCAIVSMICIPIYVIYKLIVTPGDFKARLISNLRASEEWGPAEEEHRKAWEKLTSSG